VALTDHDTAAGHEQARWAQPDSLTLTPGMELFCRLLVIIWLDIAFLPEWPSNEF
jgi:predicted metal-dependent phosphoesterase TrpH